MFIVFICHLQWRWKWHPHPVFLPGESQDGRAWWAAIHGVAQSRTGLKWLGSSSHRQSFSSSCSWCLPLVGKANLEVCVGFLVGGTDPCPLVGGAESCPTEGQDYVKGCVYRPMGSEVVTRKQMECIGGLRKTAESSCYMTVTLQAHWVWRHMCGLFLVVSQGFSAGNWIEAHGDVLPVFHCTLLHLYNLRYI